LLHPGQCLGDFVQQDCFVLPVLVERLVRKVVRRHLLEILDTVINLLSLPLEHLELLLVYLKFDGRVLLVRVD
jgi:hypothetical protein